MGQLEDILKHQNMVRNNIMKSFGAETSEDSLEKSFEDEVNPFEMEAYKSELTKAELDEFEKAKHQDGDMHPNGKWVWRASANGGKGDWRVAKPSRGGGSKATAGGAAASTPSSGSTGTPNDSSSYFSKLSNSLIEKYSKKKESVSLSDIEEFYEDFLRDRSQEPTRKVYANEAKKTYDAIVANWHKNDDTTSKPKGNAKSTSDFDSLSSAKTQLEVNKFWENVLTSNSGKGKNLAGKLLDSMKEYGYNNVSGAMTTRGVNTFKFANKDADKNITMVPYQDGLVIKTNDKKEILKVSDFKTISDFKKKFDETVLKLSGKNDDKNSEKPYIYNDGGMVGGKTQIKDEDGLLKVLNNSKSNTVLIYDKDWKGLNSEAKNIGEKNGWDVTVDVDKDGNISSTGSYIMFKKKKEDKEIPNAAQVSISNIIRRTFGKNLSSLKFKGKKVIINVDGKAYGSGYSSYVKSYYKDGKMTSRELENSYDKSSMDTVEKKLGTLIKYVNQIELIENYD